MRVIVGIVFVAVGVAWAWNIWREYRREQQRGIAGPVFDFVSGRVIDLVLVAALMFLGLLLIVGRTLG